MLIYTDLVEEIIADMAERVPGFSHLRADGIAVAAATPGAGSTHGNRATCSRLAPARARARPIRLLLTEHVAAATLATAGRRRAIERFDLTNNVATLRHLLHDAANGAGKRIEIESAPASRIPTGGESATYEAA